MRDVQSAKPDSFLLRILKELTDESYGCSENFGRVMNCQEIVSGQLWFLSLKEIVLRNYRPPE